MTLEAEPVSPGEALSGKLSGKLSTNNSGLIFGLYSINVHVVKFSIKKHNTKK